MKAITICQPWASLLACGAKEYETRSWDTGYRGPIAVHAGKKPYNHYDFSCTFYNAVKNSGIGILTYGAIIATAELVGCYRIAADKFCKTRLLCRVDDVPYDEISELDQEFLFGDWSDGRYAWELANITMLVEPVPARGRQGLWEWGG